MLDIFTAWSQYNYSTFLSFILVFILKFDAEAGDRTLQLFLLFTYAAQCFIEVFTMVTIDTVFSVCKVGLTYSCFGFYLRYSFIKCSMTSIIDKWFCTSKCEVIYCFLDKDVFFKLGKVCLLMCAVMSRSGRGEMHTFAWSMRCGMLIASNAWCLLSFDHLYTLLIIAESTF